jgi:hypothetical protein
MMPMLAFVLLTAILAALFWNLIRSRNMQYWIGSFLAWQLRRAFRPSVKPKHVYFCFVDHYEPYGGTDNKERAHRRIENWIRSYRSVAGRHTDSDGRHPQHSFFYPVEEYDPSLLDQLAQLCASGFGDVEVHIHHDNDNAENFRRTIGDFVQLLHERHALLRRDESGRLVYAFIHGNWALDNSRPDGRWCGVDNEIQVLVDTGCYADMTMPSAPSDTQTAKINSIYFAKGCPGHRKSHDQGRDVRIGSWGMPGELLLVQGPLTLNWKDAKFHLIPKIESGEVSFDAPPTDRRVRLWAACGISVHGAEEHVFIKVHTHGATESSMQMLFENGGLELLWTALEREFRDVADCCLHYVSAWEMYQTIKRLATEQ